MEKQQKRNLIIIGGLALSPFALIIAAYLIYKQPAIIFIPILIIGAIIFKKIDGKM
jgi:hypothetical protein